MRTTEKQTDILFSYFFSSPKVVCFSFKSLEIHLNWFIFGMAVLFLKKQTRKDAITKMKPWKKHTIFLNFFEFYEFLNFFNSFFFNFFFLTFLTFNFHYFKSYFDYKIEKRRNTSTLKLEMKWYFEYFICTFTMNCVVLLTMVCFIIFFIVKFSLLFVFF